MPRFDKIAIQRQLLIINHDAKAWIMRCYEHKLAYDSNFIIKSLCKKQEEISIVTIKFCSIYNIIVGWCAIIADLIKLNCWAVAEFMINFNSYRLDWSLSFLLHCQQILLMVVFRKLP